MGYMDTGAILLLEWLKTIIIFSIIDVLFIKKKISVVLKSSDTYISSLVVAGFLIILRTQNFSILSFILWTVIAILLYIALKIVYKILMDI